MQRLVIAAIAGIASLVTTSSAYAQAEHYEPFRVDSGLAGSYVSAIGRGGFGAVVEPKFLLHDNIAVGARVEAQVQFGGSFGAGGDTKVSMGAAVAVLAKGEYLLGTGTIRPFAGMGIGMFDIISQSVAAGPSMASVDQKAGRYFGIAPQLGINLGRLRLAATYNMILGADIEVHQTVGGVMQTSTFSQSYMTFEMSFRFGGGKKVAAPPPSEPMPAPAPPPTAVDPAPAAPAAPPGQAPGA